MDLQAAINDARMASDHFFNNRYAEALNLLQPWSESSMYHSVGYSVLMFLEAVLTFESHRLEKAMETVNRCMAMCDQCRKKNTITESIANLVRKPNYDFYTAEEAHAELCYAEALLLKALLTFVQDESLLSFVKAGLNIRSCYNLYKECEIILNTKKWTNGSQKDDFEGGVYMGNGVFNILIPQLPTRIIKLLEFIGFTGNKELGLKQLTTGCQLQMSIRQILCTLVLLAYHLFVVYSISDKDGDLNMCDGIISTHLKKYPTGSWFLLFKGRLELVKGNTDDAEKWYISSWKSQNTWPQFHHICFWELIWINVMKQNWSEAHKYADYLAGKSRWSKTIHAYLKAVICLMSESHNEDIDELMRNVPIWKKRVAGKSIPMEKFCVRKSKRYFSQGRTLILPAFELMYVWNIFNIFGKRKDLTHECCKCIDNTLQNLEVIQGKDGLTADNKALLLLLKGACLKLIDYPEQAEDCLKEVISMKKSVKDDIYLVPYAMFELAILYKKKNKINEALELTDNARKDYNRYPLETRLHFLIHSFQMEINPKT